MTPEAAEELSTRVDSALARLDSVLVGQPTDGFGRTQYLVVLHELPDNLERVKEDLEHCQVLLEDR